MFSTLAGLVARGVFRKVKIGFEIIGHTHDLIDQLFSRLAWKLKERDALTVEELMQVFEDAYTFMEDLDNLQKTVSQHGKRKRTIVKANVSTCKPVAVELTDAANVTEWIDRVRAKWGKLGCIHIQRIGAAGRSTGALHLFASAS